MLKVNNPHLIFNFHATPEVASNKANSTFLKKDEMSRKSADFRAKCGGVSLRMTVREARAGARR